MGPDLTGHIGHLVDKSTGLEDSSCAFPAANRFPLRRETLAMQARLYDPRIGRFYSTDPIGYQDQLNLYAYVHNDPVDMVDLFGLDSQPSSCKETRDSITCTYKRPAQANHRQYFVYDRRGKAKLKRFKAGIENAVDFLKECGVAEVEFSIGAQASFNLALRGVAGVGGTLDLGSIRVVNAQPAFTQGSSMTLFVGVPGTSFGIGGAMQAGYNVPVLNGRYGDAYRTLDYVSATQQIGGQFAIPESPPVFLGLDVGVAPGAGFASRLGVNLPGADGNCSN